MPDVSTNPIPLPGSPAFKRWEDGYFINQGACNPGAILRTMVRHLDADKSLCGEAVCQDSGLRLMMHQLNHLFNIYGGGTLDDTWDTDNMNCRGVDHAAGPSVWRTPMAKTYNSERYFIVTPAGVDGSVPTGCPGSLQRAIDLSDSMVAFGGRAWAEVVKGYDPSANPKTIVYAITADDRRLDA